MEIPAAQTRQCTECQKTYPLNLFRADGTCCRYCETGLEAHPGVFDKLRSGIDIGRPTDISKQAVQIRDNSIKNSSTNLPKDTPEKKDETVQTISADSITNPYSQQNEDK